MNYRIACLVGMAVVGLPWLIRTLIFGIGPAYESFDATTQNLLSALGIISVVAWIMLIILATAILIIGDKD